MLRKLGPNSRLTKRPTEPTFGRCLTRSSQYRVGKKTLVQREEAFALEVVSFAVQRSELETRLAAQWSELETRSQGLEALEQELDNLSVTLQGWREQLQERASKLAVADAELEEDRKSLDKWESHAANMEKQLGRQRDSLKKQKEWAEKKKAELEERSHEMEAAKAALDTRVQEAVQEAVRKLQEDQRAGAQRIADWASEASLALVPLGLSPIQVAEPPASIADALPVLNSASDRLRRLEPVLDG